ncbi:MAG: NADP-dependent isocitrate dehydrogenase, partial [Armatimonadetes bacterium]|nr:NADP-dependent isocitrate dehydrogenase [Anaerolineae bacterium]
VIARLGQQPMHFAPVSYSASTPLRIPVSVPRPPAHRDLVGVDVFLDYEIRDPNQLGAALLPTSGTDFALSMITNRGVKVYPNGMPETFCTDHWRCRFMGVDGRLTQQQVLALLGRVINAGFEVIKTEHLFNFDGQPGYSMGQGQ